MSGPFLERDHLCVVRIHFGGRNGRFDCKNEVAHPARGSSSATSDRTGLKIVSRAVQS